MKNYFKFQIAVVLIFTVTAAFAQVPEKFNYQAVCRDASGNIIASQPVALRITIRDSIPGGPLLYQENHSLVTNPYGLVNIQVGAGNPTGGGPFASIPWGNGNKYIQIEINLGAGLISVGTQQLFSVPYALYARQANNPGTPGPTGPTGPTGAQGSQGVQGITGPTGTGLIVTSYSNSTTYLSTSWMNYTGGQITMNAPRAGSINVEANVRVMLDHTNGTADELLLAIGNTVSDQGALQNQVEFTIPASYPAFGCCAGYTFTVRRTFTVATAGNYTYYLNGVMTSGFSGNDCFIAGEMQAVFY